VGTLTVIIWKNVGLGSVMYEIVPGFILNMIVMLIVNRLTKPDIQIENEFDSVVEATKKVTA
jgi:sodium/proline symporter